MHRDVHFSGVGSSSIGIALGSMTTLWRELRAEGVTTKSWTKLKDKTRAGRRIDKGYL
mgnify:CR=1 FL=1